MVNTVLWLADKAESDFVWRGGTHYIYVKTHWEQITSKEITQLLTTVANLGETMSIRQNTIGLGRVV